MSFVEDIGGEEAVKKALQAFHDRISADPSLDGAIDSDQMTVSLDEQCAALCAFIDGETDIAAEKMPAAHGFIIGQGMTDDGFDTVYDHYHDSIAELGVPGGMVHLFLESFEDLREKAVA